MPSAGQLKDHITFQARTVVDDGYGNEVSGPWTDQFTVAPRVMASPERETMTAQRLQGIDPVNVWVRW